MAVDFDPYYSWLAIPPEEQPADHYRLLGIRRFEANEEVISNASDQRMSHLRTFASGKRSADSQKLLNEISAATRCLLDPAKRKVYDDDLKQKWTSSPLPVAAQKTPLPVAQAIPIQAQAIPQLPVAAAPPHPAPPAMSILVASAQDQPGGFSIVSDARQDKRGQVRGRKQGSGVLIGAVVGLLALAGVSGAGAFMLMASKKPIADQQVPKVDPGAGQVIDPSISPPEKTKPPEVPASPPMPKSEQSETGPQPTNPADTPAATKSDQRLAWAYDEASPATRGVIREFGDGKWEEYQASGAVYPFREVSRDSDEVVLEDPQRQVKLRLTKGQMFFSAQNGNWNPLQIGRWENTGLGTTDALRTFAKANKIAGQFSQQGNAWIASPDEVRNLYELPVEPTGEYVLEATVKRHPGNHHALIFVLSFAGRQFNVSLDAAPEHGFLSGVERLNGTSVADPKNQFSKRGSVIPENHDCQVTIEVRATHITCKVDGKSVIDQPVAIDSLTKEPLNSTSNPRRIGIGTWSGAKYEISRLVYKPLAGGKLAMAMKSTLQRTGAEAVATSSPGGEVTTDNSSIQQIAFANGATASLAGQNSHLLQGKPFTLEFSYRQSGTLMQPCGLFHSGDLHVFLKPDQQDGSHCFVEMYGNKSGRGNVSASADNQWHHVAVAYDGSDVDLFLDGKRKIHVKAAELGVDAFAPVEFAKAQIGGHSGSLTGEIRDIQLRHEHRYADQVSIATSDARGTLLPAGISLALQGAKKVNAGQTSSQPGPNVRPSPESTSPSNQTASNPTPGAEYLLAFNLGDTATLNGPASEIKIGQPFTLQFWMKNEGGWKSPTALAQLGELGLVVTERNNGTRNSINVGGRVGGQGTGIERLDDLWHHWAIASDGRSIDVYLDGRTKFVAPLSNFTDKPLWPITLGEAKTPGINGSLKGTIAAVKLDDQHAFKGQPQFDPVNRTTGMLLPKGVLFELKGAVKTNSDGQPLRNSLVDLTDVPAIPDAEKSDTPDDESLKAARASIAEIYKSQLKDATKPDQKLELAKELLRTSVSEKNTATAYALLVEARSLAIASFNVQLTMDVVNEVDRRFKIDRLAAVAKLLPDLQQKNLSPEQREALMVEAMAATAEALQADRVNEADALSVVATASAAKTKDVEKRKDAKALRDHVTGIKTLWDAAQDALQKLTETPDDPAANLAAGRYYAFAGSSFAKGLPYLEKGSDEAFASAAKKSREATDDESKLAAADVWFDLLEKLKPSERLGVQRYVLQIYNDQIATAGGIAKAKLEKRVPELQAALVEHEKSVPTVTGPKSSKPIPGLMLRVFSGPAAKAVPTPMLAVVRPEGGFGFDIDQQLARYPTRRVQYVLSGFVVVEREMKVTLNFRWCKAQIGTQSFDARTNGRELSDIVTMKKGTYPILITTDIDGCVFRVNRADTGESLLFYNEQDLQTEMNKAVPVPGGTTSKGVRIDQGR